MVLVVQRVPRVQGEPEAQLETVDSHLAVHPVVVAVLVVMVQVQGVSARVMFPEAVVVQGNVTMVTQGATALLVLMLDRVEH